MQAVSQPDSKTIQSMFDRLARRYDLFNLLTSLGMAKFWRHKALEPLQEGMRVLDLGCGTGDLSLEATSRLKRAGEVLGLDFSVNMLAIARRRYEKMGSPMNGRFRLVQKSAEELPVEREPYDLVVSGFVLRNLYQNIDTILSGVWRSLKPGGRISFLDITEPAGPVRLKLWRFYMDTLVEFYGKALFGKDFLPHYLTESADRFVKPPEFVEKLKAAGFLDVTVRKFMMGSIVLYQGRKV